MLAIDAEDNEENIRKYLDKDEQCKLKFQTQKFEELKLEKCNLILANNTLSFCKKDKFEKMWNKIDEAIEQNGYFVGNFFGKNDSWNESKKSMTFFEKEEIFNLFNNFDIQNFKEIEKDGTTVSGKKKHWHIFYVIAKKIR